VNDVKVKKFKFVLCSQIYQQVHAFAALTIRLDYEKLLITLHWVLFYEGNFIHEPIYQVKSVYLLKELKWEITVQEKKKKIQNATINTRGVMVAILVHITKVLTNTTFSLLHKNKMRLKRIFLSFITT